MQYLLLTAGAPAGSAAEWFNEMNHFLFAVVSDFDHAKEILKSDALKSKSDKEIEAFIEKNLKSLDIFLDQ